MTSFRQRLQNETEFLSRIYIGQIKGVDDNGILRVFVPQIRQEVAVSVPVTVSVNGFTSSWDRMMPRVYDLVLIGFGPDNTPEILSYALFSDEQNVAGDGTYVPRKMGYAQLLQLQKDSVAGRLGTKVTANPDGTETVVTAPIGLNEFVPLQGGEFDRRSSGGAYLHGDRFGVLTLAGGAAALKLDKQRYEGRGAAGLWFFQSGPASLAFGDVKRKLLPTDFNTKAPTLVPTPQLPGKELRARVEYSAVPGVSLPVWELHGGDIRQDVVPAAFEPGVVPANPMRRVERVWGLDGVSVAYRSALDVGGNLRLETPVAAITQVTAPLSAFDLTVAQATVTASTSIDLTAPAVNINSGGTADSAMVRGTELAAYLNSLSVLTAFGPSGPPVVPFNAVPGVHLSLTAKVK